MFSVVARWVGWSRWSSLLFVGAAAALPAEGAQATSRMDTVIAGEWRSTVIDADAQGRTPRVDAGQERPAYDDSGWSRLSVPNNWQGYSYNRQVVKGARHGVAWYRTHLRIDPPRDDERVFLQFEGANSYATVWLNGRPVGRHGGGLTSFTLDVTTAVRAGDNLLAVRVDNPAGINDLPWVSGDDQADPGCCEGSQPFGIFRPVHVIRTRALRVAPFGLYAWGKLGDIDAARARLTARTELQNLSARPRAFELLVEIVAPDGKVVAQDRSGQRLAPGAALRVERMLPAIARPKLWSPASPTLYTLRARLLEGGRVVDETATPYGIRTVEVRADAAGNRRLLLNGQQFFVRGVAEYEHLLGGSHAFAPEQVAARVHQVEAAGFNAFRDAHYPHNFAYGDQIARDGLLWWPQFSAHLWADNAAFRANFRALMIDWIRERRNNPAVFLWGLQNESRLPKAFAEEMTLAIRAEDPTASEQRLVVTCNGGEGTDWNVPQNWSGTYGGDPARYGEELVKQGLVGEYGAWRSLELHSEPPFGATPFSETRMAALMEQKAYLAGTVADRSVGDFQWLLTTHENPGRPMRADGTQIWDGVRELDHVGPANNKGLMTLWGEPLDVYYMYRARQVPAGVAPMVYIVSHTWPDRWTAPGVKFGIEAYSNCDAVELFNDSAGRVSLGRRQRDGEGRFRWDGVPVRYSVLTATCLMGGKVAARDLVTLNNLPAPPAATAVAAGPALTAGEPGRRYLYRVNVGGPMVVDRHGQRWSADRHLIAGAGWGWTSWADAYPDLDPALGSRRKTFDAIAGTDTPELFQTFRFGREALRYRFAVPDGQYRIELYFAEPWYGRAGIDARGWRVFDVAVNGKTAIRDLDLFKEAGFEHAIRKVVTAEARGGWLEIGFPRVAANEAILSAIAISGNGAVSPPDDGGSDLIARWTSNGGSVRTWLDNGDAAYADTSAYWTGGAHELLDSDWLRPAARGRTAGPVTVRVNATLYLPLAANAAMPAGWGASPLAASLRDSAGVTAVRFATRTARAGETVSLPGGMPVLVRRTLPSPYAPGMFSLSREAGLFEAEGSGAKAVNGSVASDIKGYGGQGFIRFGTGAASLRWPVETGVAGRHRFRLRYALAGAARSGSLVLRDASGIVAATMKVDFTSGEGWRDVDAETPAMINAGSYSLQLDVPDGGGLAVDALRLD